MFCKTFHIIVLSCAAIIGVSNGETAKTTLWNQLGAEASKQSGGKGFAVTELWNGYRLECRMQALQAEVTMSGVKIISTSKSEGGGSFAISASQLGRTTSMQKLPDVSDWLTMKDGLVQAERKDIVEEYMTSGDGIRQDFVINNKPEGEGTLLLDLNIEGAGVTIKSQHSGIEVRLLSGRALWYHALKVTDATGQELSSNFIKSENNRITIAVDDKDGSYPVHIDPTISDADWLPMGPVPGVYGTVYALSLDSSGYLYVGGEFTTAGGIAANNIAKWNGSAWDTLGSGTSGRVSALVVDDSGNLYAGGRFLTAGTVTANNIAKWNGSVWSTLGNGTVGYVNTVVIDGSGNLYAGGYFTLAGGVTAQHVAKWNGSAWDTLGSGMNTFVSALAFDGSGKLYAGGNFTWVGGIAANHIAKWDGNSWSALGIGTNNYVQALAFDHSGNLYAAGQFDSAGGAVVNYIARWNGSVWSSVGNGMNMPVDAVAFDVFENLYAGGYFSSAGGIAANNIAKWNGSVWDTLGSGTNTWVYALAVEDSGNLYAGGAFATAGGKTVNNVAICKLNGTAVIPRKGNNVLRPFITYDALAGLMRFQLKAQTPITYRIYSLLGRQVFQASETMGAGVHSMRIYTGRAARGTYIVNFKAGNESLMFRMVVDR
ncbi:MAG: T9SS type A sorting domain-containing protein [Chitinispirillaceae bacterium]